MSIYTKETRKSVYQNVLSFLGFNYNDPSLDFATNGKLNGRVPFGTIGYAVTQSGVTAPVLTLINASYAVNADNAATSCRPGTCKCQSVTTHTFCSSACCSSATYVSPGIYKITFATAPPNGFDVLVGPGKEGYQSFGVEKIDSKNFYLKSYLNTPQPGAYADGIFSSTYVEIKIWGDFNADGDVTVEDYLS